MVKHSKSYLRSYYQSQHNDEFRMYGEKGREYKQRRRLEVLKKAMESFDLTGCRVLDIGCGDGYATGELLRQMPYKHYIGIDLSIIKLQPMRARLVESNGLMADAEILPIADNAINCVLCLETLEHLPSPDQTLREIHRVLKPGGRCILSVPVDSMLQLMWIAIRKRFPIRKKEGFNEHIQLFTLSRIRELFIQQRFHLVREELCAFSFPLDGLIQRLPYYAYRVLDVWLCHIPVQRFGIGSCISFTMGRDYYVAVLQK